MIKSGNKRVKKMGENRLKMEINMLKMGESRLRMEINELKMGES